MTKNEPKPKASEDHYIAYILQKVKKIHGIDKLKKIKTFVDTVDKHG